MASKELYCMECVEGRPVALGLCADCLAGEPLEEIIRQIASISRELEEARAHARRLCVALRAIRDEAAISGPPLESRREQWEAALREAGEVLGELEALYGE